MNFTDLNNAIPTPRTAKRIGRGKNSGHGKLAGRGGKGQTARRGFSFMLGFEGGQMPLFRRLPKRGFNNAIFRTEFTPINCGELGKYFKDGAEIKVEDYATHGMIKDFGSGIKILGEGDVPKNLKITAHRFSESAKEKIKAAGGSFTELTPSLTEEQKAQISAKRKEKRNRKKKGGGGGEQKKEGAEE